MKNFLITAGVLAITLLTAFFSAGRLANAVTGADDKSRAKSTCSEDLQRTMDDMHMAMHQVKKTGDADEDFVRLMLPHHQGAVEMAKVELLCGEDPVNRRLAQEIVVEQQSETQYTLLLSETNQPPFKNPVPLVTFTTWQDGAGVAQAIGPLKRIVSQEASSGTQNLNRRYLIVSAAESAANPVLIEKN